MSKALDDLRQRLAANRDGREAFVQHSLDAANAHVARELAAYDSYANGLADAILILEAAETPPPAPAPEPTVPVTPSPVVEEALPSNKETL